MPDKQPTIGFISDECSLATSHYLRCPKADTPTRPDFLKQLSSESAGHLTMDFAGDDTVSGSIAYHPVFGIISYDHWYYFSTKKFIDDLRAADENPAIKAHLLHIDSPGGEAFGIPEAFEAVRALKKPVYAFVESMAASAGYYIAAGAGKIYARSIFSDIGCIGAMAEIVDDSGLNEKFGIKVTAIRSSYSPLKNKVQEDVLNGHPEEYIRERLDPLAKRFIDDVRTARPDIAEDSDALKGKLYFAADAQGEGLIDGIMTIDEVIEEIDAETQIPYNSIYSININN